MDSKDNIVINVDDSEEDWAESDSSEDLYELDSSENEWTTNNSPKLHDYTTEVTNILLGLQNVNFDNALALNCELQSRLFRFRDILQGLVRKCEEKYAQNEQLLYNMMLPKRHMPNLRLCGAPYFRDTDNFVAPPNNDYVERTENGELFALDLKLTPQRYWTMADKSNLVKAIKFQVLDFLHSCSPPTKKKKTKPNSMSVVAAQKNIEFHTMSLIKLLEKAGDTFEIDWDRVSKVGFTGRHLPATCYAMWHGYMRPDINRSEWDREEQQRLLSVAEQNGFQNWTAISQEMAGRSEYQCFVQFQQTVDAHLSKNRKWTPYEDEQLLKAVQANTFGGVINWNKVQGYFVNRPKKSIYSRYNLTINPAIKKGPFTREEDCILLAAVQEYGENFACIPMSLFPNRTRNQIKSRYHNTMKYQSIKRGWSVEDDTKLIEFVSQQGIGKWSEIAKILKVHNRVSCRTRYTVIEKFFQKNPQANIEDLPRKNRGIQTDISSDNWADKIYEIKTKGEKESAELAQAAKGKKRIQKKPADNYCGRLRKWTREFYDVIKYSYDFKFGKTINVDAGSSGNVEFTFNCLDFKMNSRELGWLQRNRPENEFGLLKIARRESLARQVDMEVYQMPPNWCTLLGMRSLSILANSDSYKKIAASNAIKPRQSQSSKAEEDFKKRFTNLFKQTGLLMKMDLSNVVSSCKFVIQYVPDDENPSDGDNGAGPSTKI